MTLVRRRTLKATLRGDDGETPRPRAPVARRDAQLGGETVTLRAPITMPLTLANFERPLCAADILSGEVA